MNTLRTSFNITRSPLEPVVIIDPMPDTSSHVENVSHRSDCPTVIPIKEGTISKRPRLQPHTPSRPKPQLPPTPSPAVPVHARATSVISGDCPVDYRILLLSLADQYIAEARSLSTVLLQEQRADETDRYYKLMALGLGCLETVLKNQTWKLPPRQEATIQLRYARILYEETENDTEAEMILSKGIGFCDRYRLLDLKYSMQHLLARILFKTSSRTSLKLLDNVIQNASTCKHKVWVYAFRFLRVSLSLQLSSKQEIHAALQNVRMISEIAIKHDDIAIHVMAAVTEALIHLHSRDVNSIVDAQRAIASARAQQLNAIMKDVPQLNVLVLFLDLVCSLDPYDHKASMPKMQDMQKFLDNESCKAKISPIEDAFSVPIEGVSAGSLVLETGGVFSKSADGRDSLVFSWLARTDVYALAFLLSGVAVRYKNHNNRNKTEVFLLEGLKVTDDQRRLQEACATDSLKKAFTRRQWTTTLSCYIRIHLTLAYCDREAWPLAKSHMEALKQALRAPELEISDTLSCFEIYLKGIILQGTGDWNAAFSTYQDPSLALPLLKTYPTTPLKETLAVLAALNTLLLIRLPSNPAHHFVPILLKQLSIYVPASTSANASSSSFSENQHLASAHSFILSTLQNHSADSSHPTTNVLLTKQHLQRALHLARSLANDQLLCLCLSFFHSSFFEGIVGDQAVKSADTAQIMANGSGSKLWTCVGDGMLAQTLELCGHTEQAAKFWEEGGKLKTELPATIREALKEDANVGAGEQERVRDSDMNMDDGERECV